MFWLIIKRLVYGFLLITALVYTGCTPTSRPMPQAFPTQATTPGVKPTSLVTIAAPTQTPIPSPTFTPTATYVIPHLTPYPDDIYFSIGQSIEGRDLRVWQLGEGTTTIALVGGIHGAYEGNTVVLLERLVDHFRENPEEVLSGIRLILIPVANPDGLARGSGLESRFNANDVDLNRNWGCEWSETAYLRDIEVDPGSRPFSEPETVALRQFFVAEEPDAVLFYHSAAGGIFMGSCGQSEGAVWLGELLDDATGYPYQNEFTYYEVSGDATNWLDERGIPAAIIELYTKDSPEFNRNLAGVMALQCYFARLNGDDADDELTAILETYCQ